MEKLLEKLVEYGQNGRIPMHMPGHKRNCDVFTTAHPYKIDITEIEGFDDYHAPEDILQRSMEKASQIYGTRQTYYLVNGSTCGLLTAISATVRRGGKMLAARNCHKAVYNGMELWDILPVYVYPKLLDDMGISGEIRPEDVENTLREQPDIEAVILTSPTYEGVVSDISSIAQIVHRYGRILIVDEAHGAHFPFSERMPDSAVTAGADIVIQSLHKTLPSYTQTALLHVCSHRIDLQKIRKYLGIYQTSSPSYVFMGGMEACIEYMSGEGRKVMDSYLDRLLELRAKVDAAEGIRLLKKQEGMFDYDEGKLVIGTGGRLTGSQMSSILRKEFFIEPEMAADEYIILMTSLCDRPEWYDIIAGAAADIGSRAQKADLSVCQRAPEACIAEVVYRPVEALDKKTEPVVLSQAVGRVSAETVYVYPPGIPIIRPGERITQAICDVLTRHQDCGISLKGIQDKKGKVIRCIK